MQQRNAEVVRVLTTAETELRRIMAEAATEGDYACLDLGRGAAGQLQEILARVDARTNPPLEASEDGRERSRQVVAAAKVSKGKARRRDYPRFYVERGTLVRVGWSKKQKAEYVQRTSRSIFDAIVTAVEQLASRHGGPFSVEQIQAEVEGLAEGAIPSYQIYLVLGALQELGCIVQRGRQGYDVHDNQRTKARTGWDTLARVTA